MSCHFCARAVSTAARIAAEFVAKIPGAIALLSDAFRDAPGAILTPIDLVIVAVTVHHQFIRSIAKSQILERDGRVFSV